MPPILKRDSEKVLPESVRNSKFWQIYKDYLAPSETDIIPTAGLNAGPLVSIYKNKAARELGTKAFEKSAEGMHPFFQLAAKKFAQRYPRVAAHMKLSHTGDELQTIKLGDAIAFADIPEGKINKKVKILIGKPGLEQGEKRFKDAMSTVFEEGAHVAQGLGNRKATRLYKTANRLVDYENNPFEISAKNIATKHSDPSNYMSNLPSVTKQLGGLVDDAAKSEDWIKRIEAHPIKRILQQRARKK